MPARLRHGTASFELEPPDEAEMTRRPASAAGAGAFRIWMAERDGAVSAYAYAGPYRARPAYRFSVENSIYVAANAQRPRYRPRAYGPPESPSRRRALSADDRGDRGFGANPSIGLPAPRASGLSARLEASATSSTAGPIPC